MTETENIGTKIVKAPRVAVFSDDKVGVTRITFQDDQGEFLEIICDYVRLANYRVIGDVPGSNINHILAREIQANPLCNVSSFYEGVS